MKKRMERTDDAVSPVIGVMLMLVVTVIIAAVVSGFAGDMGLGKKTGPCVTLSKPVMEFSTAGGASYKTVSIDAVAHQHWIWHDDGFVDERDYAIERGKISILLGTGDPYGLVFTHTGGDPIDLKELQMGFSSNDLGIVIDYNSKRGGSGTSGANIPDDVGYNPGDVIQVIEGEDEYGPWTKTITYTGLQLSGGYTEDDIDDLMTEYEESIAGGINKEGYFTKINPETPDDTIIRTGDQFEVAMDGTPSAWAIQAYTSDGVYKSILIEAGSGNEWILSHKPSGQILGRGDLVYETAPDGSVF